MNAVIAVALPVFAVIALGFAAGRLKFVEAGDGAALNRFVFRFGFPAALFGLMSAATGLSAMDGAIALSYGLPAVGLMLLTYVSVRSIFHLDAQDAGAHAFASIIGNAVFLGLPIAIGVEGWARPFATLMLVEGIFIIGLGAALMAPRVEGGSLATRILAFVKRPLANPLVVAAIAGFLFSLSGLVLPGPVRTFFDLVARAAGPVALFSLGLFFATHQFPRLGDIAGKIAAVAAVKMSALPLASLFVLHLFGVDDPDYRGALALFTVVPTAVNAYVMSSQYGRYTSETAAAVALTTALSIATIVTVLILFG
jgi:hypothetical protein